MNSIEKQIGELKNIDRNDIVFNVVKIDCPDRQYPNQFEFDSTKEFSTIQEAMEYAVDDMPLLPPVGVWTVSQFQCVRLSSQTGYLSSPRWAVTPPTS